MRGEAGKGRNGLGARQPRIAQQLRVAEALHKIGDWIVVDSKSPALVKPSAHTELEAQQEQGWGQLVAVGVVLRRELEPGESVGLLGWISDSVAANLADFKRSRAMAIFSNLPRNAMGKIQKHEIVAAAINGIAPLYFI